MTINRGKTVQISRQNTTGMWSQLNDISWPLLDNEGFWKQPPQEQLRDIRRACQLFYGITDATLSRDLSWQFSRLGRVLERAEKTTRILELKYFLILPSPYKHGCVLHELQINPLPRSVAPSHMSQQYTLHGLEPMAVLT